MTQIPTCRIIPDLIRNLAPVSSSVNKMISHDEMPEGATSHLTTRAKCD